VHIAVVRVRAAEAPSTEVPNMTAAPSASPRRGFHIHAVVFVLTMILLTAIDLATGEPWWVYWPLLGWGLGLAAHWWFVLGPGAAIK
jgi:hypothetical protein